MDIIAPPHQVIMLNAHREHTLLRAGLHLELLLNRNAVYALLVMYAQLLT